MIGALLVIQMPYASNEGIMSVLSAPLNRFVLGLERSEYVINMVFDNIVVDWITLQPPFWARFYVQRLASFSLQRPSPSSSTSAAWPRGRRSSVMSEFEA